LSRHVVLGLVVGKTVGVAGGAWLAARFTKAELNKDLSWPDMLALGTLAGVGFTVSLLIGELAFEEGSALGEQTKAAVLVGSLTAALLACLLLGWRDRVYRRMREADGPDDGRPSPGSQRAPGTPTV
jgi:NhaA family Na+:H+ antiporter